MRGGKDIKEGQDKVDQKEVELIHILKVSIRDFVMSPLINRTRAARDLFITEKEKSERTKANSSDPN